MSVFMPPAYETVDPIPNYSESLQSFEVLIEAGPSPPYTRRTSHHSRNENTSTSIGESIASGGAADTSAGISTGGSPTSVFSTVPRASSVTERFVYTYGNIELDLGCRTNRLGTPSYGLNATVRGEVKVKKMLHVKSIVVKLDGRAQTTGLATGRSALKVLNLSTKVFELDKSTKIVANESSRSFRFELRLPSVIEGGSEPLPPTFRGSFTTTEGWIQYSLHVNVMKTGLWPRETLIQTINYLPKFYLRTEALLWPVISLMDAKRFGCPSDRWRTSRVHLPENAEIAFSKLPDLLGFPSLSLAVPPELSISIPSTAKAIAATCFPVNVTIHVPGASKSLLDFYVQNTEVQLVKVISLTTNGKASVHNKIVGNCRIKQIEKELVGEGTRIIRASAAAGTLEGEASWSVGGIISIEYFVRVAFNLQRDLPPLILHDEPTEMFSHSKEQFDNPLEIQDDPAVKMFRSLTNNTPSLR